MNYGPYEDNTDNLPLNLDSEGVVTDEDLPLELSQEAPLQLPSPVDNLNKVHASVLKSDLEGGNLIDTYASVESSGVPAQTLKSQLSQQRLERSRQDIRQYVEHIIADASAEETIEAVSTFTELDNNLAGEKGTAGRQVAEALAGPLSPEALELAQVEAELLAIETLSEAVDSYGTLEKAFDVVKMFFPTSAIDNTQLSGAPLGAETYARNMVVGLKDMMRNDPVRFQKVFPEIEKELREILPTGKVISVLAAVVNPRGEEELEQFSNLDAVFDLVDLATLGGGLALSAARLTRRANVIRQATRLNNKDLAADINAVGLLDETGEVAVKAGVDEETLYNNASGLVVDELDQAMTAGLSTDVLERMQRVRVQQAQSAQDLVEGKGLLQEGLLSDAQRLEVEAQWLKEMKVQAVSDVEIVGRDLTTTTFKYKVKNAEGELIDVETPMTLTIDDQTGFFRGTDQTLLNNSVNSPTVFMRDDIADVEAALRLDSTSSVVSKTFQKMQRDALKPILPRGWSALNPVARKELAEVDSVLLSGDSFVDAAGNQGKVYTVSELRGGVAGGIRLNDRQIETYYNVRSLYDTLFDLRNVTERRKRAALGQKSVVLGGGDEVIGKPYSKEGAVGALNTEGNVLIFDEVSDSVVSLSGKQVQNLYDQQGKVLVKLDGPVEKPDVGLFDLVLVDKNSIAELPQRILNYRQGYVPKVDNVSRWFVKEFKDVTVNGVMRKGATSSTVRKFATKAEADRWVATQNNPGLTVLSDRAMEQQITGSSGLGSGSGLYTGARAYEDIPYGFDGRPAERANTYESIIHNLQHLEGRITRDQWRMGLRQKWVNTAQRLGFHNIDSYTPDLIPKGDARGEQLRRIAEQIDIWSGIPTAAELRWDGLVSKLMEWSTRKWPEAAGTIAKVGSKVREHDPISYTRAATFRILLGLYSPVQVWVQAQGASVAASLHPIHAARAFHIQLAAGAYQFLSPADVARKKALAKFAGLSVKEFDALESAWKRTGYKDALQNTADYSAARRGPGLVWDTLGRAADSTTTFYRAGESGNRRLSFTIAALKKRATTGTFNFTDSQIKAVMADANHMMLDMSKANAADFQRGLTSVPTQFFQVQSKFLETIFGLNGVFTFGERVRIALGQVALYGTAGVPMLGLGVRALSELLGVTQEEVDNMDPMKVEAVNQGMWGVFFNSILGADIDVASRGAIADGVTDSILELIASDATIGEKLVGAAGSLPLRADRAWKNIAPMVASASEGNLTKEEFLRGASNVASIASSWNNLQKGHAMLKYQRIVDSRGNPVVDGKDLTMTAVMQMIGFQPKDLQITYDLEQLSRGREEYRRGVVNSMIQHYWNYIAVLDGVTDEAQRDRIIENYSAGSRFLLSGLANAEEERQVRESVRQRLYSPQTRQERAIKKYIENFSDGQVTEWASWIDAAKAPPMIQLRQNTPLIEDPEYQQNETD